MIICTVGCTLLTCPNISHKSDTIIKNKQLVTYIMAHFYVIAFGIRKDILEERVKIGTFKH